jgi:membrane-bound metal-dependent hydrolase YbcI (DUF457 family)
MSQISKSFRLTPILILGGLTLVFLLVCSFYILIFESKGGNGLAGLIGIIFSVVLSIVIYAEQLIVRPSSATNKRVAVIELCILPVVIFLLAELFIALCG